MNRDDPSYAENFVALVHAAFKDQLQGVPDERVRAAIQTALIEHPEDAWTDGVITQAGGAFNATIRRALGLQ